MTFKFPPSPEIKRSIKAVQDANVEIAQITITAEGIVILTKSGVVSQMSPYDKWKSQKDRSK